jgi:hypothetical protein
VGWEERGLGLGVSVAVPRRVALLQGVRELAVARPVMARRVEWAEPRVVVRAREAPRPLVRARAAVDKPAQRRVAAVRVAAPAVADPWTA